ncbi:MAG: SDR family oxidoreductase [Acidiferrobacterales bacterium]|nr:SDR family oxidoreductase [Acidiferrobacterales bacterium]
MSTDTLNNKVALVTGASRGIGAATAQLLAESGVSVMLLASKEDPLKDTTQSILDEGYRSAHVVADVSNLTEVQRAVRACVDEFGGLDILVNNAGVIDPISHVIDSDPVQWARAIDINLKGVYFAIHAATPEMLSRGGGTIINLSSGAANHALEGWSHYSASKSAVQRITEGVHLELSDRDIFTIGLSPGTVSTDMMQTIRDSKINAVSRLDWSAHKTPQQVAKAIVYLCGPQGQQYSGTDFSIKIEENQRLVGI